jgi:hypothetical protein
LLQLRKLGAVVAEVEVPDAFVLETLRTAQTKASARGTIERIAS